MLANDEKSEMTRILFSSIEDRAQNALDFVSEAMNEFDAKGANNNTAMLLHEGSFTCGLVENSIQAYPFVKSDDTEFMYSYLEKFRKAGVRLICTESMRQKLVFTENFRYLGYLEAPNGRKHFRIYEDVNFCSKDIRDRKRRYEDVMQDAIIEFYHGNISRARDGFSKMVLQYGIYSDAKNLCRMMNYRVVKLCFLRGNYESYNDVVQGGHS